MRGRFLTKHFILQATLVVPTPVKRRAEGKLESDTKRQKLMDSKASEQEIKDRLIDKLNAPQGGLLPIKKQDLRNLNENLTVARLAEIRAKRLANRRGQISEFDDLKAPTLTKEVSFKHEKQYRTRTTILESSGKTFSKTITATLSSIKAREEGKMVKPPQQTPRPGVPMMMPPQPQPRQLPNYNRYDQEQFQRDTHGFNIETTGTFSGINLRNVTEGNASARNKQQNSQSQQNQHHQNSNSNGVSKSIPSSVSSSNNHNSGGKRPSRTPIIIISAAPKSLITMYNAKEILQDLKFISTEDVKVKGGLKRDNEVLIQRRKEGGLTVPYRVIDNPKKLNPGDWDRVVAVFVMGQAWQFKDWPWDGNPTVIFSKICAFHIKWDEAILEKNIANWSVHVIPLSRNKRHMDRARLKVFWDVLDR